MELRAPPVVERAAEPGRGYRALLFLQVVILAALGGLYVVQTTGGRTAASTGRGELRHVASLLKAGGALEEAAELYGELALDESQDSAMRAKLAYTAGSIYLERGQYERALRWFYQSEALGAGELQQEVGKKIVHSLERLGRVHAAHAALDARTQLPTDGTIRPAGDPIVAKIGATEVHASDIQRALDDLPPQLARQFSTAAQRQAFLRKYVADELIWRKAQKLEYDRDPGVRRRLNLLFKQLVIDAFIDQEIMSKIELDLNDDDLKTFHQANRERYDEKTTDDKPAKKRSFAEISPEVRKRVERDYRIMKMQSAYQGLIAQELSAENVVLRPENLSSVQ
ncbi:MAG: hypothetical protein V3T05_06755 [Myxococcota bacterium]